MYRSAAVASSPSRSTSAARRDHESDHKSATKPTATSVEPISVGNSNSSRSTSSSSRRSDSVNARSSRSPPMKKSRAGTWYFAPVHTGPGPLPGRLKGNPDDYFTAARREVLRSTSLKERTRVAPERLTMPDWLAPRKPRVTLNVASSTDESDSGSSSVQVIQHTQHSSRKRSRSRSNSPVSATARRRASTDVKSPARRQGRARQRQRKGSSVNSRITINSTSEESDSSVSSSSSSSSSSESDSECSSTEGESESRGQSPRRRKLPVKRAPASAPAKSRGNVPAAKVRSTVTISIAPAAATKAITGQSPLKSPLSARKQRTAAERSPAAGTPRALRSTATSPTKTDTVPRAKRRLSMSGSALADKPLRLIARSPVSAVRRLNLSSASSSELPSPTKLRRSVSASNTMTALLPTRLTRQQVAASMAVEEELEASLCAELQRRVCGSATPTKSFTPRLLHTPSPTPFSPAAAAASASNRDNSASATRAPSPLTAAASALPPAAAALNESARLRLALSSVSNPAYLSADWIFKRAQKYLGVLGDEAAANLERTKAANPNPVYVAKKPSMGCLDNEAVFVAVSAHADHNPFYLDEQRKADPALHAALACKWVEIGNSDSDEEMGAPVTCSSADLLYNSGGLAVVNNTAKKSKERIPMLGLFAKRAFAKNEWVTEYGGVLEWAGEARRRAHECNTHVRRIAASDYVWNGRPWSLFFPRIPSTLQWEADKPLSKRTHLKPLVNPRTLINLLLLLHHEQEMHANRPAAGSSAAANAEGPWPMVTGAPEQQRTKNVAKPFTEADCSIRRICTGTCLICRNELKVIRGRLDLSAGIAGPPELTPEDVLATLLPQCACCSVSLGLLPCEVVELMSSWPEENYRSICSSSVFSSPPPHVNVLELCSYVEKKLIHAGGLGFMANTDVKANQNVRVHSVSQFNKEIASMAPTVHIYQAMRDIQAGEELLVAYNNNEAKKMIA